jgi:hypothetical protein
VQVVEVNLDGQLNKSSDGRRRVTMFKKMFCLQLEQSMHVIT